MLTSFKLAHKCTTVAAASARGGGVEVARGMLAASGGHGVPLTSNAPALMATAPLSTSAMQRDRQVFKRELAERVKEKITDVLETTKEKLVDLKDVTKEKAHDLKESLRHAADAPPPKGWPLSDDELQRAIDERQQRESRAPGAINAHYRATHRADGGAGTDTTAKLASDAEAEKIHKNLDSLDGQA